VQFHYALVDDLIGREEFEQRVEEKIQQCGDLLDDTTAAMIVVQELGRSHVKISKLSGDSSLFSFFGKVLSITPPREFARRDGEKSWVAYLILADETGQVQAVLWDEKAAAVAEIELGEVLEIIGKHPPGTKKDITVLALRKSPCEIICSAEIQPRFVPAERKDLVARILTLNEPRIIERKDGSTTTLIEGCIAYSGGTARIITFSPEFLAELNEGTVVRICGALEKARGYGREFVIDDKSRIMAEDQDVPFQMTPLREVRIGTICSVEGAIASMQPIRDFTTRDGRHGHVRNVQITDGQTSLQAVLWGELALQSLIEGDRITIYNGTGKSGRNGELELHAGTGSFIRVYLPDQGHEAELEGTVIATRNGTFLDNGQERFLLTGDLPNGHEVKVRGRIVGERIIPFSFEEVQIEPGVICQRLEQLLAEPDRNNTFTLHGREDI
jgi:replication factor A1